MDNNNDTEVKILNNINLHITNNIIDLPKEKNYSSDLPEEEEKGEAEQNLMFGLKKVSPFKLYYHISGKFEIFLMIVGTIFTIGAGCSGALISLLLGDTINDFTNTNEIESLPDAEYNAILDKVEPEINKMVKKFLIIGSILFDVFMGLFFLKADALDENKLFLFNIKARARMVR